MPKGEETNTYSAVIVLDGLTYVPEAEQPGNPNLSIESFIAFVIRIRPSIAIMGSVPPEKGSAAGSLEGMVLALASPFSVCSWP